MLQFTSSDLQLEAIALAGVAVAKEAPDGMVGVQVHPQVLGFDQSVAGVEAQHLAHEELAVWAESERNLAPAFEREGRLRDPRHRHIGSRDQLQARGLNLADTGRKIDRADIHALGEILVDEVDDEGAGLGDVASCVLRRLVRLVLQPEHDQRRVFRENVEEAERRRVDDPVAPDARH